MPATVTNKSPVAAYLETMSGTHLSDTKQLGEDPQTPYLQLTLQQVLEEVWTPRRATRRQQRHRPVCEPRARH